MSATIEIDATGLREGPVAVIAPGAMPGFPNPGVIVQAPGQTTVELRRVPECFTPALVDSAGHQTKLSPICVMSGLGCSLARRGPAASGASLLAVAWLVLLGLGRRWRRSPA